MAAGRLTQVVCVCGCRTCFGNISGAAGAEPLSAVALALSIVDLGIRLMRGPAGCSLHIPSIGIRV